MPSRSIGLGGTLHVGLTVTVSLFSVRVQVVNVRNVVEVAANVDALGVIVMTFVAAGRVRVRAFGRRLVVTTEDVA